MVTARKRRIEYVDIDAIVPAARNPKRHDLDGVRRSIATLGYIDPVVQDERTGRLIGGHGRVEALQAMRDAGEPAPDGVVVDGGAWKVPLVRGWASDDDRAADAAVVALNRYVELGGWDNRELVDVLGALDDSLLAIAGYDTANIDAILAHLTPEPEAAPILEAPSKIPKRALTNPGDVWILGEHRIVCGSAHDPAAYEALLGGRLVNLAVTSPPYADRRGYDEDSGFAPVRPEAYVEWFAPVAANIAVYLAADGSWCVNIKPGVYDLQTDLYVHDLVAAHVREWDWLFVTEFCWERNGVPKAPTTRLKNQFEPIYQFTRDRWKFRPDNVRHVSDGAIFPIGPGAGDTGWAGRQGVPGKMTFEGQRKRRPHSAPGTMADSQGVNVGPGDSTGRGWAYPGNRIPPMMSDHEATGHAAAFPVGLPEFFAKLMTDPGDVVLDPFCGSGSTILAAHRSGRIGFGIELSPKYCDLICGRFHASTGVRAVRERDGKPGYVYP